MLKKILCVLLCVLTVALLISGCKTEKDSETATSVVQKQAQEQLAGGWQINTDFESAKMPESAKKAFDKAVKDKDGLKAVAYLGSQVVAGMNYAFLCQDTKSGDTFYIVKIYNDLKGNATITSLSPFDFTKQ